MEQIKIKHVKTDSQFHIVVEADEISKHRTNYSLISIVTMLFLMTSCILLFIISFTDGGIIPSSENISVEHNKNDLKMAPFCNGTSFCDDPSYYPSDKVLKIMDRSNRLFSSMFNKFPRTKSEPERPKRSMEEGEYACEMYRRTIVPRVATNTRGKFQFIVNTPDINQEYIQQVHIGLCRDPGKACMRAEGPFMDYDTECRQQTLEVKLLAVEEGSEFPIIDTFEFPSGCACFVKMSEF
jgi:hypothetical protein